MATGTSTPQPRLPMWLKLVLILAIVVGLGLVALEIWDRSATARWQRYADKLRENGQPLTLTEVEAQRTVIPADQNGAKVIERLAVELNDLGKTPSLNVFYFSDNMPNRDLFFEGVPRAYIEESRTFWRDQESILVALEKLESLPTGRFDIDAGNPNPWMILIPECSHVRQALKLIRLDNAVRLIDSDIEGAARRVRVQFHLAATLAEYPCVVGRLVQMAVEHNAASSIEDILRVGKVDRGLLERMQKDIESRLIASTMKWAWLGERAIIVGGFEGLATGQFTFDAMMGGGGASSFSLSNLIPVATFRSHQLRAAEQMTWLIEADDDPAALNNALRKCGDGERAGIDHRLRDLKLPLLPDFRYW